MIDVIGTERYLTKIDGTHKIGFSAAHELPLSSTPNSNADALRLSEEAVSERNLP